MQISEVHEVTMSSLEILTDGIHGKILRVIQNHLDILITQLDLISFHGHLAGNEIKDSFPVNKWNSW